MFQGDSFLGFLCFPEKCALFFDNPARATLAKHIDVWQEKYHFDKKELLHVLYHLSIFYIEYIRILFKIKNL